LSKPSTVGGGHAQRPRPYPRTPGRGPGNAEDRFRASADASFLIGMCR
jgi:hypothetical protein